MSTTHRSRRSVLVAVGTLASGAIGGCSIPSMGGNDPYTPTAVVVENRSDDRHTVTVVATDGPRTPRTTVGIEPGGATGDGEALTVIAGFFTEPGRYDVEARTTSGGLARQEGVRLWRAPEGGLDGQVPLVVIRENGSLTITVVGESVPPTPDQ